MHEQPVPYLALQSIYFFFHALGSLFVVESHDHDAEVIRRVASEGVLEETLGCFLRILAAPDEVDRGLVVADVPELVISLLQRFEREELTPSHATIKNSSFSSTTVSVVYGEPTTNSFIDVSPKERVTANTPRYQLRSPQMDVSANSPLTRLLSTNPPASVIRFASCVSLPL